MGAPAWSLLTLLDTSKWVLDVATKETYRGFGELGIVAGSH